jgi:PAS domain S-box-containing protein
MPDEDAFLVENQQIFELFRQLSDAEQAIHALIDEQMATSTGIETPSGLLRQIQGSLQESETRYRHLINRISALVCEMDPHGTILMMNEAAARIIGFLPEELIGLNAWDVLFPEPYTREAQNLRRILNRRDVINYEVTLQAKDGSAVVMEFNTANDYDSLGQLEKIIAFGTDISARRQAEEKARSNEQKLSEVQEMAYLEQIQKEEAIRERDIRFRAAVEASLDAMFILRAERNENGDVQDFQIVEVNSVGERQLNRPHDQVIGQHLRDGYQGPEEEKIYQSYTRVLETGQPLEDEYQIETNTGDKEWYHYQVVPLPDGVAVSHRNITLRKQIEQALQESEKRYRDIVETAGEGIWMADLDDRIVFANQQLSNLLGYSLDEIVGVRIFQFMNTESRFLLLSRMDRRRPEIKETLDLLFLHKDGSEIWTMATVTPIYGSHQEYKGSLGMVTDIHQRKAMEAELAEMRRRLMESREQERLQLAQDLHDGPIQDLYGLVFLINSLRQAGPALDESVLEQVHTHLNHVIGTLRNVCGELRPPTLTPFGLEKAIRSHAEVFRSTHPEIKMRLELMRDGQRLSESVRVALFRIYQSMLSNTVRHARARHVVIRLNLDDHSVTLEILDDGVGFSVPVRLIELARQGHLGIVGVYERAEAVGGKVDLYSSPGKGTRVRVVVPILPIIPSE